MKLFLSKIIQFLLLIIVTVVSVSTLLNTHLNNKTQFALNKNVESIVFGHSHPETAFNDSLIVNFKNLAQSGESYFYTFIKAKQVFKHNPQIKNVFIEFSNIDVTQIRDEEIWNEKYINWRYPTYASWMNISEQAYLLAKNPKIVIATLPKTYKNQIERIRSNRFNYIKSTGGYLYLTESKLDSLIAVNYNKQEPENKYFIKSVANLYYLEKLIALCYENNKQVYFVRSPLYKDSFYRVNEELFQEIKKEMFPKIKFLDYVDFDIPNSYFRDLHHLNYKGAIQFSNMFNSKLQQLTTEQ
ncbi:hypothetical protein [Aequorivita sp. Q41]|uniref:hypothetical protein n=1 Tax=Aequorivita sp. Q41 TaxID=3153300 RepID=UPI0032428145